MNIQTNLKGRINNTQLPLTQGLMPLFEAVQNSIHAIEEAKLDPSKGKIVVDIIRDNQIKILPDHLEHRPGPESQADIQGFKITDNGIGFNDRNMLSFETLDSDLKASIGGRGVGRLLWLKAFQSAEVDSVFVDTDGAKKKRSFVFTAENGVKNTASPKRPSHDWASTTVYLTGFNEKYREASRKTLAAIACHLFEHCLWYFVRDGGVPTILVRDDEDVLNLDEVYDEHMHSSANKENIEIKGIEFELTHIKLKSTSFQNHLIGWCASNRLVKEESITSKVKGLYGRLGNGDDQFIYACYVSSKYLDEKVRPERTDFSLEKNHNNGLFSDSEISKAELLDAVLGYAEAYLAPYLESKLEAGLERVHQFIAKKKPSYRPILGRIPKDDLYIKPDATDKEVDIFLHTHRSKIESQLLSDGHNIMNPLDTEDLEDYEVRVKQYLKLADDIKKSDLADYVFHRKVILDILRVAIQRDEDGKYKREDLIHKLVMPMSKTSNSIEFERNNLWLIDERLTFHDFLASDKTLNSMPITDSTETKEPDIIALNVFDKPLLLSESKDPPFASLVIVELKRPMRNDAKSGEKHDPIEQSLGYLNRIRSGKMNTASGRPIPNAQEVPGFCYVICDLTESIENRCKILGLTATSDHLGYFGYNPSLKAYIEVISYDQLFQNGLQRNRAFFDMLGLPAN